jgi:hypothetical protein
MFCLQAVINFLIFIVQTHHTSFHFLQHVLAHQAILRYLTFLHSHDDSDYWGCVAGF